MNHYMTYTITETHSNQSKNDYSSIDLHDAMVLFTWFVKKNLVLSVNGFTVMPHREHNETDRYLQTGAGDIYIYDTELPDNFPLDATDYALNRHWYDQAKGIFYLECFLPSRQCERFAFPCRKVEYVFHEFVGDARIQTIRNSQRILVSTLIEQGHGWAWSTLKKAKPKIREEYIDLIFHTATVDQRLDFQCDPPRTAYIMDLISLYDGKDGSHSKQKILDELMGGAWRDCWKENVNPDDFSHCVRMILANREHPMANEALEHLQAMLTTPDNEWQKQKRDNLTALIGDKESEDDIPTTLRPQQEYTMEQIIELCRTSTSSVLPARFHKFF